MYATWFDYNVITNMGSEKEVLTFDVSNIAEWTLESSPSGAGRPRNNQAYIGTSGRNSWAESWLAYGARPALYQEWTGE